MDLKPPKVWVAVLLTLLLSVGLGHVYSGRILRGIGVFFIWEIVFFSIFLFFAVGSVGLIALVGIPVVAVGVVIAICVDAARCARSGRLRFHSRRTLFAACVAYFLVFAALGLYVNMMREQYGGSSFWLPSAGMSPTLLVGDHVFLNPFAYAMQAPERGDIVIFVAARRGTWIVPVDVASDLPRESFVKRIVGVPGDTIEFKGHVLLVNGRRKTSPSTGGSFADGRGINALVAVEVLNGRSYQVLDDPRRAGADFGPAVVERDRYFVAGDNRDNSYDSRMFGTIHRDDILGATASIYWSWDFDGRYLQLLNPLVWSELLGSKTRWERIGSATN